MSQVENSKRSLSSNSMGWYITHKIVLLIIVFAAYTYFSVVPEGMVNTAIAIGLLAIASATVMAGRVIDLGLPINCLLSFTIAKLLYTQISGDTPGAYTTEICLGLGILGSGITGLITGKILTRKYIPPYIGSFAVPLILLYLVYLIFNNTSQSINDFLSLRNIYEINNTFLYIGAGVLGVLTLLIASSKFGKNLRATGSSAAAAAEAGINSDCSIIMAYTLSGLLAGMAGIFLVDIPGDSIATFSFPLFSWLPAVILGAIIGGNKFSGGRFDVIGAFLGGIITVLVSAIITDFTGSEIQAKTVILLVMLILVMATDMQRSR